MMLSTEHLGVVILQTHEKTEMIEANQILELTWTFQETVSLSTLND